MFSNGQIQAVYVIHARHLAGRADHIASQLARFQIPYELIEEHDPDAIDPALTEHVMRSENPCPIGVLSCALKHIEALRRIAAHGYHRALVLEDDAILDQNFTGVLSKILAEAEAIDHPHTIQIGSGGNMFIPPQHLRPGKYLYEANQVRTNDGYLIGAETARLRLAWLERNQLYAAADHLYNRIDREMGIRRYWSEPAIVVQGSISGLFPSTIDEGRRGRKGKPLWEVRLRFGWQRLRRKYLYPLFHYRTNLYVVK